MARTTTCPEITGSDVADSDCRYSHAEAPGKNRGKKNSVSLFIPYFFVVAIESVRGNLILSGAPPHLHVKPRSMVK
jgi:hypothetical protein